MHEHIYGYWENIDGGGVYDSKEQLKRNIKDNSDWDHWFNYCPICGEDIREIIEEARNA